MESVAAPNDSEEDRLVALLDRLRPRTIVVVTGAGLSKDSGIPTYRGAEGYWTTTSANYQPEEIGYLSTFRADPREVWRWTLYHRGICQAAAPNDAHLALARLEQVLGDDFTVVTQNVDGLHILAGNTPARTIEAHGTLRHMRVLDGGPERLPIPEGVPSLARDEDLTEEQWALLNPEGQRMRPHTMFFDEAYDQAHWQTETSTTAARDCDLLIVVGTSGATALPWQMAVQAREADAAIITIDPDDTPFGVHARNRERVGKGLWLRGTSTRWVPRLVDELLRVRSLPPRAEPPTSAPKTKPAPLVARATPLPPRAAPDSPDFEASSRLADLLSRRPPRRILLCTGAGISAESGIPTFRGSNGYWVLGPRAQRPVTRAEFERDPRGVWAFQLHRRGVCNTAEPNAAHLAFAQLERDLGDDVCLVTQNIDGLHRRAGNSPARTIELHGNCNMMRAAEGTSDMIPIPTTLPDLARDEPLRDEDFAALIMPDGRPARPHILLWDEAYEETHYRSESALAAAGACDLLVVVGTSGSAAMPYAIAAEAVLEADATLIDINLEDNAYAEHARDRAEHGKGLSLTGTATRWVPELVEQLLALRRSE